jgi:hypothetical protein
MQLTLTINDRQLEMLLRIVEQRTAVGGRVTIQDVAQAALNRGLRDEHDDTKIRWAMLGDEFASLALLARQAS